MMAGKPFAQIRRKVLVPCRLDLATHDAQQSALAQCRAARSRSLNRWTLPEAVRGRLCRSARRRDAIAA